MRNKKSISILIFIVMMLQLALAPIVHGDETGYYSILEPKAYRLKNTYLLENTGGNEAFSVKATVLVGVVSNSPYQQNISYKVTPWPKYTYVDSFGNIYAEVHIDSIDPQETKTITVEKQIINSGVSYSRDIYKMDTDYTEFKQGLNNLQYLEPGRKVEVNAPEISAKAADFDASQTEVELEKDIYDFVNTYITYDTNSDYANKGALSAMITARGVCDEYAALFTALSRSLDVPSRIVTGYWLDKDEPLRMGAWNDISTHAHAWAEFYLPDAGWIPVEPTFIYTYNGVRRPNNDYFANIKADDIHLLHGYQSNDINKDVSISYSYYRDTDVEISFGDQAVMLVNSLASAYGFNDTSTNWAKDYIDKLYSQGILFAKQPGLYKPKDDITRAEFAAFLVNTMRLTPKTSGISFKDINDESDYADFIKTAAAYKLISGDPQGYFKPDDNITRQDAAAIMQRAINLLNANYLAAAEPGFYDVDQISPYAKEAVKLIYNMEIMTGKPGNLFEPKSFTTRAEAAKILDSFVDAID